MKEPLLPVEVPKCSFCYQLHAADFSVDFRSCSVIVAQRLEISG